VSLRFIDDEGKDNCLVFALEVPFEFKL